MTTPESVKQALLNYGWNADERRHVAEVLHALEQSAECRDAAAAYDRIREGWTVKPDEAEPRGGWQAFEDRVCAVGASSQSWSWLRLTSVAALLLAAVWLGRLTASRNQAPDGPLGGTAPSGLVFTASEVIENLAAFQQIAQMFDGRASWLMVSDEASDLGLAADPGSSSARPLMIRLAIVDEQGIKSRTDLTIIPGQDATVTVPFEGERRLRYHISTTADDEQRLTVWFEVLGPHETRQMEAVLAAAFDIRPGELRSVGRVVTPSGGYGLNVSLARLPDSSHGNTR